MSSGDESQVRPTLPDLSGIPEGSFVDIDDSCDDDDVDTDGDSTSEEGAADDTEKASDSPGQEPGTTVADEQHDFAHSARTPESSIRKLKKSSLVPTLSTFSEEEEVGSHGKLSLSVQNHEQKASESHEQRTQDVDSPVQDPAAITTVAAEVPHPMQKRIAAGVLPTLSAFAGEQKHAEAAEAQEARSVDDEMMALGSLPLMGLFESVFQWCRAVAVSFPASQLDHAHFITRLYEVSQHEPLEKVRFLVAWSVLHASHFPPAGGPPPLSSFDWDEIMQEYELYARRGAGASGELGAAAAGEEGHRSDGVIINGKGQLLQLRFACSNLPQLGFFSRSDPLVIIYQRMKGRKRSELVGSTEWLADTYNPTFEEHVPFRPSRSMCPQKLVLQVVDVDSRVVTPKDLIGRAVVDVQVLLDNLGKDVTLQLVHPTNPRRQHLLQKKHSLLTVSAHPLSGTGEDHRRLCSSVTFAELLHHDFQPEIDHLESTRTPAEQMMDRDAPARSALDALREEFEQDCMQHPACWKQLQKRPIQVRAEVAAKFVLNAQRNRPAEITEPTAAWRLRVYHVHHSMLYTNFMRLCVMAHMLLALVEPSICPRTFVFEEFETVFVVEAVIIGIYALDILLGGLASGFDSLVRGPPLFNGLVTLLLVADYATLMGLRTYFLRPLRCMRPIKMIAVDFHLLRVAQALVATVPKLIDFFVILSFTFLCMGIYCLHLMGDLYFETVEINTTAAGNETIMPLSIELVPLEENFKDITNSMFSLITFMTLDNWPDIGLPAYEEEPFFMLLFVFIALLFVVVLSIAIPFVLEGFKEYRRYQYNKDQKQELKNLMWAFCCLDTDKSQDLDHKEFVAIAQQLLARAQWEAIPSFFHVLDVDNDGKISMAEFMKVCDWIVWRTDVQDPPPPCPCACSRVLCRANESINKLLHFDQVAKSRLFLSLVFLMVMLNATVLASWRADLTEDEIFIRRALDYGCSGFFTLEAVVKIIGLGCPLYWVNPWNRMDFVLAIFGITFTAVSVAGVMDGSGVGELNNSSTVALLGVGKLARLSQVAKIIRTFSIFRVGKLVSSMANLTKRVVAKDTKAHELEKTEGKSGECNNVLLEWVSALFERIDFLITTLARVIPGLFDTMWMILMFFYLYALVGQECFAAHLAESVKDPKWAEQFDPMPMFGFDHFGLALLTLFQIWTASEWTTVLNKLLFNVPANLQIFVYIYVLSFYFLTYFVCVNLMTALVWDMFVVMRNELERKEKICADLKNIKDASNLPEEPPGGNNDTEMKDFQTVQGKGRPIVKGKFSVVQTVSKNYDQLMFGQPSL